MTYGNEPSGQPEPGAEVSVLRTTGLLGPAEIASVRPGRFRRDSASQRAAAADPVRWHHDLATEPALTAAQAAPLLAVDEDQAGRILGWLRSRGLLLAVRRPDGLAYLRFQFDPVGRGLHRVVALVNVWLGAGSDPYTVAGWWLRPREDGRRACDLVGTLDEDLVLEFAAADINRHVLTFGVQPEPQSRPTAADSSRPTLFLDDSDPATLPPQRRPAGSSMWWRRRRTDHVAAPATVTARRRLRGVTNRLRHRRGQQTQHPGDHPATVPADPTQTVRGTERRAPSR